MVILGQVLVGLECSSVLKILLICPFPVGHQRRFFSAIHCKNMIWLLEVKLIEVGEPPEGWVPTILPQT